MILWFSEGYFSYPLILLVISILSMGVSIYEMRSNLKRIRRMALYECKVNVMRDGEFGKRIDVDSS